MSFAALVAAGFVLGFNLSPSSEDEDEDDDDDDEESELGSSAPIRRAYAWNLRRDVRGT